MADRKRKRLEKNLDKQRATRATRERRRQESLYVGGDKEKEQVDNLVRQLSDIQVDMATFTEEGQAWLDIRNVDNRTNEQRMMSEIMQKRMLYACASQLRGGLSVDKVLSAAGMYVAMSALSPQFREMTNQMKAKGMDAMMNYMADHPDKKFLGMRGMLMKGMSEKRDKYLAAANAGRVPFTPETAAVVDIRMSMEAYEQMRDGRHDPKEVMSRFNEARSTLYDVMREDGVTREDMAQSQRIIVGKIIEAHPEFKQKFTEAGYGHWMRSDPREVREPVYDEQNRPHMETHKVWTGEYEAEDASGNPVKVEPDATFTPREPMNEEDYAYSIMTAVDDHDAGYDLLNETELGMARNDIMQVFEKSQGGPGRCVSSDPNNQALFDAAVNNIRDSRMMAHADWEFSSGDEPVEARLHRVEMLGLFGAVAKQSATVLYAEQYSDTPSSFDAVDGQHAADISSLARSFAGRMAGADTRSPEFMRHVREISDWYAQASACVDAGLDVDMSNPETRQALSDYMNDNDNYKKYVDMRDSMQSTMVMYTKSVNAMMRYGNSREQSIAMLHAAENDAAEIWLQEGGNALSDPSTGLEQSREWADRVIGSIDMSDIPMGDYSRDKSGASRTASSRSKTEERARRADMKFGDIGNDGYDNGRQYE